MASKKRRKGSGKRVDDRVIAERELCKGNAKRALKHARNIYRQDPSHEHRELMRSALLARVRELHRQNMREPARAALVELNTFVDATTEDADEIRRLNVLLGLGSERDNEQQLAENPEWLAQMFDEAIVNGVGVGCPANLAASARRFRQALELVEAGHDTQARELLVDVERNSPLADWKLFVRGLIAFYAQDEPTRDANWSRLDASRPPRRIAEALTLAASHSVPGDSFQLTTARAALESPLISRLRRLNSVLLDQGPWVTHYTTLKRDFGHSRPDVMRRVSVVLVGKFLEAEDAEELERLRRVRPILPWDHRLNRAFALLNEFDDEVDEALKNWHAYIDDLRGNQELSESRRQTAIALVYEHMGTLCGNEAWSLGNMPSLPFLHEEDFEALREPVIEKFNESAIEYYMQSRRHDPQLKSAYLGHADTLLATDDIEAANAVYEEFGEAFADDFDALIKVARHFQVEACDPALAKSYARRAEKLRPRDETVADQLWLASFECARQAAREQQFGLAVAEMDEAETYISQTRAAYVLASMRAAIELKAGNDHAAEKHIEFVVQHATSLPAAMLAICANAFRCGVRNDIRANLNERLKAAMKSPADYAAAGELSRLMNSLKTSHVEYHGIKTHIKLVATYLGRCVRAKWTESDLMDAVDFGLTYQENDLDVLLRKLSSRGTRLFPKNPLFHYGLGLHEVMRGPRKCKPSKAMRSLREAIELNAVSDKRLSEEQMQMARKCLHALECIPRGFRGMFGRSPFAGPDFAGGEFEGFDDLGQFGFPPEIKEIAEELGIDVKDLLAAMLRGESPEEFFARHGPQQQKPVY